jgi:hypothetical protein
MVNYNIQNYIEALKKNVKRINEIKIPATIRVAGKINIDLCNITPY